jgi:hypothetical protein
MSGWRDEDLALLARTDLLRIAGRRADGTLRHPVTIGAVVLRGEVLVRSLDGEGAAWYRGVLVRGEGRISLPGLDVDVVVARADSDEGEVDAAYRSKYGTDSGVRRMTSEPARSTTLRVEPTA